MPAVSGNEAAGLGILACVLGSSVLSAAGVAAGVNKFRNAKFDGTVPVEPDNTKRKAMVELFIRPVEAMPKAKKEAYQHWALVFTFEDESYRTLEGFNDLKQKKLLPKYTKERPRQEGKYIPLMEVEELSPADLHKLAENNECNGKPYLATIYNCQTWVLNIAKSFGEAMVEKIKKFKTFEEENPVTAALGAAVGFSVNAILDVIPDGSQDAKCNSCVKN